MIGINTFTDEISNGVSSTSTQTTSPPLHTFPSSTTISLPLQTNRDFLEDEISTILINSDSFECNENFSIYLKIILDNVYNVEDQPPSYQDLSYYSLKLIESNLFTKNFKFCVGKIIAFLDTFTLMTHERLNESNEADDVVVEDDEKVRYESECLKEFLCITLLLLLKIKNCEREEQEREEERDSQCTALNLIDSNELFQALSGFHIMSTFSSFIPVQIIAIDKQLSRFVILKFSCDIMFEYFYHVELLSDAELTELTEKDLISTLVKYLLNNENFNNYDLDSDDFNNEERLIAYEELKLLLLINEQFLMKSYNPNYSSTNKNLVFEELMNSLTNLNHITGFINLLIYHLNREESHIIKILILKFLYLVFVSSSTCKLIYLNDLKILLDVIIRELNNSDEDNRILTMTYLRVLYPILTFSEISENDNHRGYKNDEILEMLSSIILNSEIKSVDTEEEASISKLAIKCMNVKWLRQHQRNQKQQQQQQRQEKSVSPESTSSDEIKLNDDINTSKESLTGSFARVASVRASSRRDYHKHTTAHNIERKNSGKKKTNSMVVENNGNVFLSEKFSRISVNESSLDIDEPEDNNNHHNLLDLPDEYLNSKPLPKIPLPERRRQ
ncbi:hypothetical protein G210_0424, partial [Candida maltosa Xu316]